MEKCTPPETRTQNLLLRRQTPYPLGQWSIIDHLSTLYIISTVSNQKREQTHHTHKMTETNNRVHSLLEHFLGPLFQVHSVNQILLHSSIKLHSTISIICIISLLFCSVKMEKAGVALLLLISFDESYPVGFIPCRKLSRYRCSRSLLRLNA